MATIVAFHAHPDDEVLLTGGTIARLAADGHRVVIAVACDGDIWNGPDQGRRLAELRASAAILGAAEVVHVGYADSGHGPLLYEDPTASITCWRRGRCAAFPSRISPWRRSGGSSDQAVLSISWNTAVTQTLKWPAGKTGSPRCSG